MNAADLIGQYIKLRDKLEALMKEAEEKLSPYRVAMQTIEGALTDQLNVTGGQSIKTELGTAYRSTVLAVRCADRETFISWVFKHGYSDFITSAVSKDAVKEYMESTKGEKPPGVDVTWIHKTNVRRS